MIRSKHTILINSYIHSEMYKKLYYVFFIKYIKKICLYKFGNSVNVQRTKVNNKTLVLNNQLD